MSRVVHFEIHAHDPNRAVKFYSDVFGWEFKQWGSENYWLIMTGPEGTPGINGGLFKRMGDPPPPTNPVSAYVCTVDVDNIDKALVQVMSKGGQVAVPKQAVPGVGWLAYCKDTEDNLFGLMQNDPNAK